MQRGGQFPIPASAAGLQVAREVWGMAAKLTYEQKRAILLTLKSVPDHLKPYVGSVRLTESGKIQVFAKPGAILPGQSDGSDFVDRLDVQDSQLVLQNASVPALGGGSQSLVKQLAPGETGLTAPFKILQQGKHFYGYNRVGENWRKGEMTEYGVGLSDGNFFSKSENPDLMFNDVREVDSPSESLSELMGLTDQDLINRMVTALELATSKDGLWEVAGSKMVNRFLNGGKPQDVMYWGVESQLSKRISSSIDYSRYRDGFQDKARAFLKKHDTLDGFSTLATTHLSQELEFPFSLTTAITRSLSLKALVGGTQGRRAIITGATYRKVQRREYIDLPIRFVLRDTFSAGNDRNRNLPGLKEMWILQHIRSDGRKYQPFVNEIHVN